jgi:hypothetical protein
MSLRKLLSSDYSFNAGLEKGEEMAQGNRYEIRTGKFGQYFYDTDDEKDMPLIDVLYILNETNLLEKTRSVVEDRGLDRQLAAFVDNCKKQQFLNVLVVLNDMQRRALELFDERLKK